MAEYQFSDLSGLFDPKSVVLIGASERRESIGGRAMANLVDESDFHGELWLVNPTRTEVLGRPCYPSVAALPVVPDMALFAIPAGGVLPALEECAAKGVRFAIVLTSGFGETGPEGKALEQRMRDIAAKSGMRIYGPNCPGLTNVNRKLGFTFSPAFKLDLQSGPVGIATQGGGLGRNFLQAMERGVGVGMWSSAGNECDLEVSDFIHYMADAPDIRVIATLIEGIKDGAKFVRAVQHAAARGKPVVALKIGKSDYGIQAAQSHTAAIAGSAEVNSAVFRQLGVVEVDDVDELIDTAWLFARALPKPGDQLAIYCSSGGTAALTADAVGREGLTLATFTAQTRERLAKALPSFAAVDNPVDTTTEPLTNPAVVDETLAAVVDDPSVALVLFPFPLEYGKASTESAHSAVRVQATTTKPIVPVWMSDRTGEGWRAFVQAGMVPASSVRIAVAAVRHWCEWGEWRGRRDAAWQPRVAAGLRAGAGEVHAVSETEAKAWLRRNGIATLASEVATRREDVRDVAGRVGFPAVAKIVSADIVHKTDAGGVVVGLRDAAEAEAAWDRIMASVRAKHPEARIEGLLIERMAGNGGVETLVGVHRDPVFGPIITFGLGGIHVEVFKDAARRLLPLTRDEALSMVREVRSYALLEGVRGRPRADIEGLVDFLVKVSDLVVGEGDAIEEMDLNPVWVGPPGGGGPSVVPLDAVIVRAAPSSS